MSKPLEGYKVIELASVLAGPAVGMFFAELGAEVIKIENILSNGDVTRSWKTIREAPDQLSSYFSSINYGKAHYFKNLKDPSDLDWIRGHIKTADIVISNFKSSSAKAFGLTYAELKQLNPGVILGTIKGFEHSTRPAYDAVLQAETGFMGLNGTDSPTKMPVALIDILAAHHLKEGILVGLLKKMKTSNGCEVNVSLEAAAIASLANQASNYLMNEDVPKRNGSLHPNIAPYGEILETKDNWQIVLAIGNNKQFAALCETLGLDIHQTPIYNSNIKRVAARKEIHKKLNKASKTRLGNDLYNTLLDLSVPVGKIKALDEVLESDVAQDLILEEWIENQFTRRIKTAIFSISS